MKLEHNLSPSIFYMLNNLFWDKQWKIEDRSENPQSLFNKFSEMLANFNLEEQKLILKITKRHFLKINLSDYLSIIQYLLNSLEVKNKEIDDVNKKIKNIFVAPLTNKNDINKIKSSSLVSYLFKSVELSYNQSPFRITVIDCIKSIKDKKRIINENNQAVLLIVDDFIGSGESAKSCINYIEENHNIKKEKIIITSLAAQTKGIELIEDMGYRTLVHHEINKGITDNYSGITKDRYLKIMEGIEKRLNVNQKNRFGFNQSEAMISLIRTPNNTFPVYWFDKSYHPYKAPFPRYHF